MLDPMDAVHTVTLDEAEAVSRSWWIPLVYGILSALIGLYILGHQWTIGGLAGFIGVILIFEGLFTAALPGLGRMRIWAAGVGVLAIIAGIAIIVWPSRGLLAVAELIAAYVVIKGVFNLVTSLSSRHAVGYWWIGVLLGILEVAVGLWLMRRPGVTLYLVIVLTGVWFVVQGILQVVLAFEVKNLPHLLRQIQGERGAAPAPHAPAAPGT